MAKLSRLPFTLIARPFRNRERGVSPKPRRGDLQMKYLLLIYHDEEHWKELGESERQQIYGEYGKLRERLRTSGQFLDGSQVQPTTTASSIRVREGEELIIDGPSAGPHEPLGGSILGCTPTPDEGRAG